MLPWRIRLIIAVFKLLLIVTVFLWFLPLTELDNTNKYSLRRLIKVIKIPKQINYKIDYPAFQCNTIIVVCIAIRTYLLTPITFRHIFHIRTVARNWWSPASSLWRLQGYKKNSNCSRFYFPLFKENKWNKCWVTSRCLQSRTNHVWGLTHWITIRRCKPVVTKNYDILI